MLLNSDGKLQVLLHQPRRVQNGNDLCRRFPRRHLATNVFADEFQRGLRIEQLEHDIFHDDFAFFHAGRYIPEAVELTG